MNTGDRVKIKEYEYIIKNTVEYNLFIDPDMKRFCGRDVTLTTEKVKTYGTIYRVKENTWWWHENWLTGNFLSDEDFEI